MTVGSTDHGTRTCYEPPEIRSNPPPWEEGRQYTLFRRVAVAAGQAVTIIVGPGQGEGTRVISGIQISPSPGLIDIQFGQSISGVKVGLAATGQTTNDFWNFYNRDNGQGGWRVNGALPNLKFADGSASSVGLVVSNAPGRWYNGSSDAMYGTYLYPLGAGNITLVVTNLPAGENDFYIYGYQGNYHLTVGSTDYGTRTCYEPPETRSNPPPWEEGRQFTLFRRVAVATGQAVTIIVGPGQGEGTRVISGIQISSVPPCTPHPATATATVVNGVVVGVAITDGGCGYTNAPAVLIQGGGDWCHRHGCSEQRSCDRRHDH